MCRVGRKEEAGDEEDGVQGIAGEIELGSVIPTAPVNRDCDYPRSTFAIVLVSRRLVTLFQFTYHYNS
jgi:hypothetical protein